MIVELDLADCPPGGLLVRADQGGEVAHIGQHGGIGVDAHRLGGVGHSVPKVWVADGQPQDAGTPGGDALDAEQAAHEGGLAAAGWPQQSGDRAPGKRAGQAVEDLRAAAVHHEIRDLDTEFSR